MTILGFNISITRTKPNNKNKAKSRVNRGPERLDAQNKRIKRHRGGQPGNDNAMSHGAPKGNWNAKKYFPLKYDKPIDRDRKSLMEFLVFMVKNVIEQKIDPRAASSVNGLVENVLYCMIHTHAEKKLDEIEQRQKNLNRSLSDALANKQKQALREKMKRSHNSRSGGIDRTKHDSKRKSI